MFLLCMVKLMVFQNVSPGQEDPSLALHNAIFCTNEIIALSSSSSSLSSPMRCCHCYCCCCCCCIVHKGKFISGTIYFFPGSDVYCSALFFFIMIPIHSLEPYFVHNQRQCLLGKHTRSSNESMLQKSCCSDFMFFFLCCCCHHRATAAYLPSILTHNLCVLFGLLKQNTH